MFCPQVCSRCWIHPYNPTAAEAHRQGRGRHARLLIIINIMIMFFTIILWRTGPSRGIDPSDRLWLGTCISLTKEIPSRASPSAPTCSRVPPRRAGPSAPRGTLGLRRGCALGAWSAASAWRSCSARTGARHHYQYILYTVLLVCFCLSIISAASAWRSCSARTGARQEWPSQRGVAWLRARCGRGFR
jgi:hypothetical protein